MCVFHVIDNNNILAISILIFAFIIIIYFVCGSIIMLNSAMPCHALPSQVECVELEGSALENIVCKVVRQETRVIPYPLTAMPDVTSKNVSSPRTAVNARQRRDAVSAKHQRRRQSPGFAMP